MTIPVTLTGAENKINERAGGCKIVHKLTPSKSYATSTAAMATRS